ncbi:MAG: ABC transporter ATP-binding protein [Veillonellales bacterium]
MTPILLKIENLTVRYAAGSFAVTAVDDVSLILKQGESLGIIGESGSGKTTTALAVLGLLGRETGVCGQVYYRSTELLQLPEPERNRYRWGKIALVFQNSLDVLNPVLTVREQILECLREHTILGNREAKEKVGSLLAMVGLDPDRQYDYPHQLSGGMRQRVLLAMALSCEPDVLLVDEPTNALDAVAKQEIAALLRQLHCEQKFGMIVISHEIGLVAGLTSRLAVMYKGRIVEEGPTEKIMEHPLHTYTRGLLNASPEINPFRDLWGIPGEEKETEGGGCPFYPRCSQCLAVCESQKPLLQPAEPGHLVACNRGGIVTVLKGSGICKTYKLQGKEIPACDECAIEIRSGEIAALIGQSGSGKTTLASILCGVLDADAGEVLFQGDKVKHNGATCRKNGMQIVFQDPYSSLNEQFTVEAAVREPLDILRDPASAAERQEAVRKALIQVQLPMRDDFLRRKCYTLSGGQRQRVSLARALVMEPVLLIADEISSMLDPSTQANILRLLKGLQNRSGFAMLYITHDLAVAQKIADTVYVMYQGRIVEHGDAQTVFFKPAQEYTKQLLGVGQAGEI